MTVLVTGGSGFLGHALVMRLLAEGESVIATSRTTENQFAARGMRWITLEAAAFKELAPVIAGVSKVYHLAWSTVPSTANLDPESDAADNIIGSLRLIEAMRDQPAKRLVFISSGGTVYGRLRSVPATEDHPTQPIAAYGVSKLAVEHYLEVYRENFGLDYKILRFGNVFGPGQISKYAFGIIAAFCSKAVQGETSVIFGDGKMIRDYLYLDDAIDALLLAGQVATAHRIFNAGSGVGRSPVDIVVSIERALGRKVPIRYEAGRSFDVPVSVLDIRLAQSELGWQPRTSFDEGIARTLAALKQRQS